MEIVTTETETVIYPMLVETDMETDGDFYIALVDNYTLVNSRVVSEDDLPLIIAGLEKALEITNQ